MPSPRLLGIIVADVRERERPPGGRPMGVGGSTRDRLEAMQCSRCLTYVGESATFCEQCGAPLGPTVGAPPARRSRGGLLAAVVVVALAATTALFVLTSRRTGPDPPDRSGAALPAVSTARSVPSPGPEPRPPVATPSTSGGATPSRPAPLELPVGLVSVVDRWDGVLRRTPAAVVGGAWLALPRSAAAGGARLAFREGETDAEEATGAVWRPFEDVALFALPPDAELPSPPLVKWIEDEPLEWLSLEGTRAGEVDVGATETRGLYVVFALPSSLRSAGVLIQGDAVVGWTFGEALAGGWLWAGRDSDALTPETTVREFYALTFGDSREERFLEARRRADGLTLLERFRLVADGFHREPRLPPGEAPPELRDKSMGEELASLVALLGRAGSRQEIVRHCDAALLAAAQNGALVLAVVEALALENGADAALLLLEQVVPLLSTLASAELAEIQSLERELHIRAVEEALARSDQRAAWSSWERARAQVPADEDIHLLGVEIALHGGDWRTAERILNERVYTGESAVRARKLAERIRLLALPEGKIVIRFAPGSRSIPTDGVIDGKLTQRFLVDTGATITTVPSSVLAALGIAITPQTPRVSVSTAGGERIAPEITLGRVDVQGAQVTNLTAIALDLPGQEGLGLIGLNFLRHFHVDLNTDEGVLVLEPKE